MAPARDRQQRAHRVPKQLMCPISKKFMKQPVIVPSTQKTCDHKSLVSLRMNRDNNNNQLPREDEDELLMPDHDLRVQNSVWLHRYDRRPPFAYISTPHDLELAITSLLTREENDILEDSDLLQNLRQLNSAIQRKSSILNAAMGFSSAVFSSTVLRLIASCPVSSDDHVTKWVQFSVGILARAHNIDNNDHDHFINYRHPVLAVVDRVCAHIHDTEFQSGLVNLIDSFMEIGSSREIIIEHNNVVRALSSNIMCLINRRFATTSEDHFNKLYSTIMRLWFSENGLRKPRLSQAVASLVWPIHRQMSMTQYHDLLQILSSIQGDLEFFKELGTLEHLTRAGLVSRVFDVLNYAKLPHEEKRNNLDGWVAKRHTPDEDEGEEFPVIERCFEILSNLSCVTIGRLEIVRVIKRSGYTALEAFYDAILRTAIPGREDAHLISALTVIFNLLEYARYTALFEKQGPVYHTFWRLDFQRGFSRRVRALGRDISASVARIRVEEQAPPLVQNY